MDSEQVISYQILSVGSTYNIADAPTAIKYLIIASLIVICFLLVI